MEYNWFNLTKFLKRILISPEIVYHLNNKKMFQNFVKERSFEFRYLKKIINPVNLIYKYKTEGRSPRDFRNYQNSIKLFIKLRNSDVNPR